MTSRWVARKAQRDQRDHRRDVLHELRRTAEDTPGQMDGWEHRRLTGAELDRLGEQLGIPAAPVCRSAEEIRERTVKMIHAAQVLLTTSGGGAYTRGACRSLERLLAWIDGDDDED